MASVPPNCVVVDKLKTAVLDPASDFKIAGDELYTPSFASSASSAPSNPDFEIWDEAFLDILGDKPELHLLVEDPEYAFAWEAPVWIRETDEVFFTSMGGQPHRSRSDVNRNNKIHRICLKDLKPGTTYKREDVVTEIPVDSPHVQMTNGGTNYRDKLLFANEGRGPHPGSITLIDRSPPYNVECLLNNFYGRRFNSPNDLCVHPTSGAIFFTDPTYAYNQDFAPEPALPNNVYCFNPSTGHLRVVADGIGMPNGICFNPEGSVCYITDTSAINARGPSEWNAKGATIYAYSVVGAGKDHRLVHKRVFAWVDTGVPDGIKSDTSGNIYSACGDGVHIWNNVGVLLGKIKAYNGSIGNLVFCGDGRLVFHSGERLYMAQLKRSVQGCPLDSY